MEDGLGHSANTHSIGEYLAKFGGPPAMLWHYTTGAGLLGIVQDGAIRCTNIYQMNDAQEYYYAWDLLQRVYESDDYRPKFPRIAERGDALIYALRSSTYRDIDAMVTCFTTLRDDLSQWRGYGSAGDGYALGFSSAKLQEMAKGQGRWLVPVAYGEDAERRVVQFLSDAELIMKDIPDNELEDAANEANFIGQFVSAFWSGIACSVKHEAFRAESEWRIITPQDSMRPEDVMFQPKRGYVQAFSQIPFRSAHGKTNPAFNPIEEILIGPRESHKLALQSVEYLRDSLLHTVRVGCSRAPLQGG